MVADLVRDDVGLREVARRAEARLQLVVEGEVDVDLLVGGAVEGADRGAGAPAGRAGLPREDLQRRLAVLAPAAAEDVVPHVLGRAEHLPDELRLLVGPLRPLALGGRRAFGGAAPAVQQPARVDAEDEREDDDNQSPTPAPDGHAAAPEPNPPPVFDVPALAQATQFHVSFLRKGCRVLGVG